MSFDDGIWEQMLNLSEKFGTTEVYSPAFQGHIAECKVSSSDCTDKSREDSERFDSPFKIDSPDVPSESASADDNDSDKHEKGKTVHNNLELLPNITSVDEEVILKNKLSLEEIKDIPRFKDHKLGEPSRVIMMIIIKIKMMMMMMMYLIMIMIRIFDDDNDI